MAYASAAELIFTHHDRGIEHVTLSAQVGGELGRVVCFIGVGLLLNTLSNTI